MIRELTVPEMHDVLGRQWYGHIACCASKRHPYVVPITYVYDANAVYTFAFEGEKTAIMRKNPHVCFQVEKFMPNDTWKSVMLWGRFEELEGKERARAMSMLIDRLWQTGNREESIYMPFRDSKEAMERAMDDRGAILYRINVDTMTGRLEQYE